METRCFTTQVRNRRKTKTKENKRNKETILMFSAARNMIARSMNQFVQECVGLGLDVNVRNNKGATPVSRRQGEERESLVTMGEVRRENRGTMTDLFLFYLFYLFFFCCSFTWRL